mmetsp:Transcript_20432/g.26415  ORF Transcript_20432/g.26415 Transcript_20432/m.26415 type:complete len:118 (-) Transcript_20432:130-483(-)
MWSTYQTSPMYWICVYSDPNTKRRVVSMILLGVFVTLGCTLVYHLMAKSISIMFQAKRSTKFCFRNHESPIRPFILHSNFNVMILKLICCSCISNHLSFQRKNEDNERATKKFYFVY